MKTTLCDEVVELRWNVKDSHERKTAFLVKREKFISPGEFDDYLNAYRIGKWDRPQLVNSSVWNNRYKTKNFLATDEIKFFTKPEETGVTWDLTHSGNICDEGFTIYITEH